MSDVPSEMEIKEEIASGSESDDSDLEETVIKDEVPEGVLNSATPAVAVKEEVGSAVDKTRGSGMDWTTESGPPLGSSDDIGMTRPIGVLPVSGRTLPMSHHTERLQSKLLSRSFNMGIGGRHLSFLT